MFLYISLDFHDYSLSIKGIQLLETLTVDNFFQVAIRIVTDATIIVEHHQFAIFCSIGLPGGKRVNIGIAIVSKLRPFVVQFANFECKDITFLSNIIRNSNN